MEYTTIQKTADRWGVSRAYVHMLCQNGRIPGAVFENKHWRIPVDAQKPVSTGPVGTCPASKKAKEWGVSVDAVTRLCEAGAVPGAVHTGNRWQIPEDAVYPREGFISVSEMAQKWGMHRGVVSRLCKDGRIPGVKRVGSYWYIPVDAKKPTNEKTGRKPGYISATKAAENWGTSRNFVCKACREDRIPGAVFVGDKWHIPEDAACPLRAKKPMDENAEPKTRYVSSLKMAEIWGTSNMFVCKACREGRIPGAKKSGSAWRIPEDAEYPVGDGKRK